MTFADSTDLSIITSQKQIYIVFNTNGSMFTSGYFASWEEPVGSCASNIK